MGGGRGTKERGKKVRGKRREKERRRRGVAEEEEQKERAGFPKTEGACWPGSRDRGSSSLSLARSHLMQARMLGNSSLFHGRLDF